MCLTHPLTYVCSDLWREHHKECHSQYSLHCCWEQLRCASWFTGIAVELLGWPVYSWLLVLSTLCFRGSRGREEAIPSPHPTPQGLTVSREQPNQRSQWGMWDGKMAKRQYRGSQESPALAMASCIDQQVGAVSSVCGLYWALLLGSCFLPWASDIIKRCLQKSFVQTC